MLPVLLIIVALAGGLLWLGEANGVIDIPGLEPQVAPAMSYGVPSPTAGPSEPTAVAPTLAPASAPLLASPIPFSTSTEAAIQPTYFDPSADTPTPVSTAQDWCGHQLDEPFGSKNKLIIHKVGGGDSLNRLEIIYKTSVQAIEGVNLHFRLPVPVNTVLVIPLNTTEVGSLPVFEPLQVSERNIPIQTMAFKAKADLLAFEEYNGFDATCRDFIGWVVAPRERPSP